MAIILSSSESAPLCSIVEFLLNNIYKNSTGTSQETHYVSATKPNLLMLIRERVGVYCENHTGHTDTLCGQNAVYIGIQFYLTGNTLHLRYKAQPVNAD
jgi:hypothetical protein